MWSPPENNFIVNIVNLKDLADLSFKFVSISMDRN